MGASNEATLHQEMDQGGMERQTPNGPPGNDFASRSGRNRPDGKPSIPRPRHLALQGRPLGTKSAPVAAYAENVDPLVLGDPDGSVESALAHLAADAVRAIDQRVATGEATGPAVVEVIRTVFGGVFAGTLDRAPHGSGDPLAGIADDPDDQRRLDRIVRAVQAILAEQHAAVPGGP